jgi:hypothetical protein
VVTVIPVMSAHSCTVAQLIRASSEKLENSLTTIDVTRAPATATDNRHPGDHQLSSSAPGSTISQATELVSVPELERIVNDVPAVRALT